MSEIRILQIQIPAAIITIGQNCFALTKVTVESPSYLKAIEPLTFQATVVKKIQLPLSIRPPSTEPNRVAISSSSIRNDIHRRSQ
jgi:hypothetical protein